MSQQNSKSYKLPASWAPHLMPILLSTFMSGLVALVVTIKLYDGTSSLLTNWLNSWFSSWVIAYPSLLVVLPIVKRIVAFITHPPTSSGGGN